MQKIFQHSRNVSHSIRGEAGEIHFFSVATGERAQILYFMHKERLEIKKRVSFSYGRCELTCN